MSYTVYYHTACKGFYGRAFGMIAQLKHGGATFDCQETAEAGEGHGFAPPMCKFPEGFTISQTCAIAYQIGEDLNQLGDGSKVCVDT